MKDGDLDLDAEIEGLWRDIKQHIDSHSGAVGYTGTYATVQAMKKLIRERLERIVKTARAAKR